MASQQAGWLDRIFNSTIGLPQQLIWRIIRAIKGDADFFSEEGMFDAALIPGLGIFDTHEKDVMPDYMAESLGLEPGLANELMVAIASDPLTYLTGGLSAAGKIAKGANMAARLESVNRIAQTSAKAGGRHGMPIPGAARKAVGEGGERVYKSPEEMLSQMTGKDLMGVLEHAERHVVGNPRAYGAATLTKEQMKRGASWKKLSDKPYSTTDAAKELRGIRKAKTFLGNMDETQGATKVLELVKSTADRQLAVGIPILASFGAKITIPTAHKNWWQAYSAGKSSIIDRGKGLSETLGISAITRQIAGVPWVDWGLRHGAAPWRQLKGGFEVGVEARTAVKESERSLTERLGSKIDAGEGPLLERTELTLEELKHWMGSTGGGNELAMQLRTTNDPHYFVAQFNEALERTMKLMRPAKGGKGIQTNIPESEAVSLAFSKAFQELSNEGESAKEVWARLIGVNVENADSVVLPATKEEMLRELPRRINHAAKQHKHAQDLAWSGEYDARLRRVAVGKKGEELADARAALHNRIEPLADFTFQGGQKLRTLINKIFKTGTETKHAQAAMGEFLAHSARGHDQVSALGKLLYTGLKAVAKESEEFNEESIVKVLEGILEADTLPEELASAFHLGSANPTNALENLESVDNFMNRFKSGMQSIELHLRSNGVSKEISERIVAKLQHEITDYLPLEDARFVTTTKKRVGVDLVPGETIKELSEQQQMRMERPWNSHELRSIKPRLDEVGADQGLNGRQVGTLSEAEVDRALKEVQEKGYRVYRPHEVVHEISRNSTIAKFIADYGMTPQQLMSIARRKTRKGQKNLVAGTAEEVLAETPLWPIKAKWRVNDARREAEIFGIDLQDIRGQWEASEDRIYGWKSHSYSIQVPSDLPLPAWFTQKYGYSTGTRRIKFESLEEAMTVMRTVLETPKAKQWSFKRSLKSGNVPTVTKKIKVPVEGKGSLAELKASLPPDQWALLRGRKGGEVRRFDESLLDAAAKNDYTRLDQVKRYRANSKAARLKEQPIGTPEPHLSLTRKYYFPPKDNELFYEAVIRPRERTPIVDITNPVMQKGGRYGSRLDVVGTPSGVIPGLEASESKAIPRTLLESYKMLDPSEFEKLADFQKIEYQKLVNEEMKDPQFMGHIFARNVMNRKNLKRFFDVQRQKGIVNPRIPEELLDNLASDIAAMNARMRDIVLAEMPKKFQQLTEVAQKINLSTFRMARNSGVIVAGHPIGYVGRYFTNAARSRIKEVVGSMQSEELGQGILARLTTKHPNQFKRDFDAYTVEDINDLFSELRKERMRTTSPKVKKFHDDIEKILVEEGYKIKGAGKKPKWNPELGPIDKDTGKPKGDFEEIPWSEDQLAHDPLQSLLIRLGHANQEKSLEGYIDNWLRAGKVGSGDSLAIGGKIVGILDDAGREIDVKGMRLKTEIRIESAPGTGMQPNKKDIGEIVATEAGETVRKERPRTLLLEDADGEIHQIPFGALNGTGFGLLTLGDAGMVKELGYTPSVAKSFVQASTRSDLDQRMIRGTGLLDQSLEKNMELVNQHVIFGAENIVLGGIKTASDTLQITPAAWRTFDSVNYLIKSFQTVFRVPFQIANLSSGVFQMHMAGVSPKNIIASYADTYRLLWGDTNWIKGHDALLNMLEVDGYTSNGWRVMPRLDAIQSARRAGGAEFDALSFEEMERFNLHKTEDLVLNLRHGQKLHMADFIRAASEGQLYGTFATSLTRGSRTVPESLMRLKLTAMSPMGIKNFGGRVLGKALEAVGVRPGELREVTEAINRTATAIGLVREGHSLDSAIQVTRSAHVPYEKLTPFEKNKMKRAFTYYTFPRHYAPWATQRFMEDPTRLAAITNTIRNERLISTQEGRASLVLGDYRLDVGRLNANVEASMMVASFADALAMPIGRVAGLGPTKAYPYDPNVLNDQITDMGLTSFGGIWSVITGGSRLLPQGSRTEGRVPNSWDEARSMIWPIKMANAIWRGLGSDAGLITPSKEERSPYVDYTPMESFMADTNFGLGVRKVRPQHEFMNAYYEMRSIHRKLQLRIAATEDPGTKTKLTENAQLLGDTLKAMKIDGDQRYFKSKD